MARYWKIDLQKAFDITEDIKFDEAGLLKLNCDKALFHLNWLPALSYNDLIEFTASWYYNYYNSKNNMYDITINQIKNYEKTAFAKSINWTK